MLPLRVLVVDELEPVRAKIRKLVDAAGWQVCAEGEGEFAALEAVEQCKADLVVLDIGVVVPNALNTIRLIRAKHPHVRILATSVYVTPDLANSMKSAGAHGLVQKVDIARDLFIAVRAFTEGQEFFPVLAA